MHLVKVNSVTQVTHILSDFLCVSVVSVAERWLLNFPAMITDLSISLLPSHSRF